MRGRAPTADCTAGACTSRRVHEQPRRSPLGAAYAGIAAEPLACDQQSRPGQRGRASLSPACSCTAHRRIPPFLSGRRDNHALFD